MKVEVRHKFTAHLISGKTMKLVGFASNETCGVSLDLGLYVNAHDAYTADEKDDMRFYVVESDGTAIPLGMFKTTKEAESAFRSYCKLACEDINESEDMNHV